MDNQKKHTIKVIVITAAIACLLTNTVRDLSFVAQNGKIVKKTNTVTKLLKDYYLYDIDEEKLADYASLGMTVSLDEPYTKYYDKESFSLYMANNEGSFIGVGVVISIDKDTNRVTVVSPYEDSPGEKAGILADDVILAVDGETVTAENINDIASKMRGDGLENAVGTSVTLKIQRDGGEPFDVTLTREKVQRHSVKSKMLSDGVAYMRITSFDSKRQNASQEEKNTYDEFMENITSLNDQGMQKLILDLRGNPGGDLDVVCKIADKFLPEGKIITYTEDKKGNRKMQRSNEKPLGLPLVVLVNGGSGSASEVLTGALKDHQAATIVGTKTYGKGIVQTVIPLSDGSGMSVTSARYFTPNGVCIHGIGIEPDIQVQMPKTLENLPVSQLDESQDVQLKKAIEIIETK